MQNLTQENSGSTPETTTSTEQPLDTVTQAQAVLSEPAAGGEEQEVQEEEVEKGTTSAATVETVAVFPPKENESGLQIAETPETVACTQAAEGETAAQPPSQPLKDMEKMETDSATMQSAPTDCDMNRDTQSGEQPTNKQEKEPHFARRYVLSKKAMTDPLKIDMTNPPPLSCEYFI